ncbi:MAG: TonB family protein [Bacteroidetes bacterium]|nr:TonB family protein [Bacteroidota bacterium]
MMRYLLLPLMLLAFSKSSFAQTDTLEYFITHANKKCDPQWGFYYRRVFKDMNWWHVMDYYVATSTLASNSFYKERGIDTFTVLEGRHSTYYQNGQLQETCQYLDDKIVGIAKKYSENGKLIDSAYYRKGIPAKTRYKWSDSGQVVFKGVYDEGGSGVGEEWEYFGDGKLMGYGKTSTGYLKDSTWTWFYESGKPSSIEQYRSDSLVSAQCFEPDGKPSSGPCVPEKMPEPGYNVLQFLGQNMHYPSEAIQSNIEGAVTVQFIVNTDGRISDIKSIGRHLGGGCDEEAIRVVSSMPKWVAGRYHNRKVVVYYTQPVSFKLE